MHNHNALPHHLWKPFSQFGLHGDFWTLQLETLIDTWIVLSLLFIVSMYIYRCLKNEQSLVRHAVLSYVKYFQDILIQSIHACPIEHLSFIGTLFTFIVLCNMIQIIIPWSEEPTKDLNTTFALSILALVYVHFHAIKARGIKNYIAGYFAPFFFMFPLHVLGLFSSILSLSFRLYGNIFAGFIISSLYTGMLSGSILLQTIGLITGTNLSMILIFGLFEGLIQAFVFTMLTTTYLSMEVLHEEEDATNFNIIP
ncbi:MAG TPA: FoF1 ATP synthase subunit a [Candidatus Saccharimonadales bacterium]|nr:FoF1 ATP synthase subunit a [Candidatus Saccharimonadales bacterium]